MGKNIKINKEKENVSKIMNFTANSFFNNIDDKILIQLAYAGRLLDLCNALSIELNSLEESDTYEC